MCTAHTVKLLIKALTKFLKWFSLVIKANKITSLWIFLETTWLITVIRDFGFVLKTSFIRPQTIHTKFYVNGFSGLSVTDSCSCIYVIIGLQSRGLDASGARQIKAIHCGRPNVWTALVCRSPRRALLAASPRQTNVPRSVGDMSNEFVQSNLHSAIADCDNVRRSRYCICKTSPEVGVVAY